MNGCYYARQALHTSLSEFLEAHGLNPAPIPTRRPPPARTFQKQLERVALSGRAIAAIQRRLPVGADERRMIATLVDVACDERDREPAGSGAAAPQRPVRPDDAAAPRRIQSFRWTRTRAPK